MIGYIKMITFEHLKDLIKSTNNMFLAHFISQGDDLLVKCKQWLETPLNVIIVPTHFNTRFMATYKNHNFGLLPVNQALFIITNSQDTHEDVLNSLLDKVSLPTLLDIIYGKTQSIAELKKYNTHSNVIWDFYNYNIYYKI